MALSPRLRRLAAAAFGFLSVTFAQADPVEKFEFSFTFDATAWVSGTFDGTESADGLSVSLLENTLALSFNFWGLETILPAGSVFAGRRINEDQSVYPPTWESWGGADPVVYYSASANNFIFAADPPDLQPFFSYFSLLGTTSTWNVEPVVDSVDPNFITYQATDLSSWHLASVPPPSGVPDGGMTALLLLSALTCLRMLRPRL